MKYIYKKKNCRLCQSKKIDKVFELCDSPLANSLAKTKKESQKSKIFPLNLNFCNNCFHLQLEHVVSEKKFYKKYLYMTGISKKFQKHFKNYAKKVSAKFDKNSKLSVLEIGSNDCTLLDLFKKMNWKTVGIEPAKNLYNQTKHKHDIINDFYNQKTNKIIKRKYDSFDLILANNVFAHIDDLKKVFVFLKSIMHDESLIVVEVSYLYDVIKKKLFDTIYHEHLDYHSVISFIPFIKKLNLKIINLERVNTHGGSIRIFIAKNSSLRKIKNEKINKYIKNELILGLNNKNTYKAFINSLNNEKNKMIKYFSKIKKELIYGYGAPAKAVTLINFFNLNSDIIKLTIDDSKIKQKKYLPGSNIKIYNSDILSKKQPKYIVILAWNVYEDILEKIKKYKKIKYAIIPLPKFRVIKL